MRVSNPVSSHTALTDVSVGDHHYQDHEARHHDGGQDEMAHDNLGGLTARNHIHVEAKVTAGSSGGESVTWSTAFSTAPALGLGHDDSAPFDSIIAATARSTTGATLETYSYDGSTPYSLVKTVLAMEVS